MAVQQQEDEERKKEEEEREKLKSEWLNLLFTEQSVAAMSPEGPVPIFQEGGSKNPKTLLVWVGDKPKDEYNLLRDLPSHVSNAGLLSLAWTQHPAAEGYQDFNLKAPEVVDASWYLRDRQGFENADLDMLHDVELLGRSICEALEPKIAEYGLGWENVVLMGFGKGAGIALYASLLKVFPKSVAAMILFSPVVMFPAFLGEKLQKMKSGNVSAPMKVFTVWGNKNRSTPGTYRQLLSQTLRKAPQVSVTPDTLPDGDHSFDEKSFNILQSLLPMCLR